MGKGRGKRAEATERRSLELWDWPDPAMENPLVPDLVQYGSQGQIIEVS